VPLAAGFGAALAAPLAGAPVAALGAADPAGCGLAVWAVLYPAEAAG